MKIIRHEVSNPSQCDSVFTNVITLWRFVALQVKENDSHTVMIIRHTLMVKDLKIFTLF